MFNIKVEREGGFDKVVLEAVAESPEEREAIDELALAMRGEMGSSWDRANLVYSISLKESKVGIILNRK